MSVVKPRIKELREDAVSWPTCSETLSIQTRRFWHGRGRPQNKEGSDTCQCYAKYKINNRYFCRKHAGLYLLDLMTGKRK